MAEYTAATVLTMGAVVLLELLLLRTGLFRRLQYWLTMAIVLAFQVPVDGWLTRFPDPVVRYASDRISGLRFPLDIPVEDFGFGWAMVTFALLLWSAAGRHSNPGPGPSATLPDAQPAPTPKAER